ncbi:unnamed protein product [Caenorhabditis bovis]|uniref:Major facilitator superfamily (MFS) profile domain-containing protein n=1 Tax=Caenorhabditis bovis TaxID=2654633 RepID=A0A8S1F5T6_9PELO|nr:unnamed protein product [Caenorhabditis bovis]
MQVPVRFLTLICATLCLTSILSNMNTFNFTKICMQDEKNNVNLTKWEESFLQSSVAIGSLAASIPYSIAYQHFSHKYVFISAGIISAVSTTLVPLCSSLGFGYFAAARIFQGVAFSATFPLAGSITARWATPHEHGVFIGLLTGNTQLANIFTMPVSGWLCSSSAGWRSVYYVHAGVSVVVFAIFLLFFKNYPEEHCWIGRRELDKLEKTRKSQKVSKNLPLCHIITSLPLWACWIGAIGDLITVQLVSMFNPQYMKNYLDYDVLSSGFLAALPIIFQFFVKLTSGISSDLIKCISETLKTKIFNTIALGVSAVFFIVLAFIPQKDHLTAIIILVFAESLLGCNTAGFNKCATLHSQQYAYFAMQQIMNIWALTIFIEPYFVNMILHENSFADWRNCFLAHAIILLVVNTFFCIFADARPAWWTKNGEDSEEECKDEKTKL